MSIFDPNAIAATVTASPENAATETSITATSSVSPMTPSSSSSSSSLVNQLYDDILHSIYAFANLKYDQYEDFMDSAMTCKRWYEAAGTMRFHNEIDYSCTSFSQPCEVLRTSRSPLRCVVSSICYHHEAVKEEVKTSFFHHLVNEIDIGERFSHIQRLQLPIILHHSEPYDLSAVYTTKKTNEREVEDDRILVFRLPSQLRSLTIIFQLVDHDKLTVWHEDEDLVSEGDNNNNNNEGGNTVRAHVCDQISRVIEMMREAIRVSGCQRLERLECKFGGKNYGVHYLPAAALRSLADVDTITHFTVSSPTLQCCDVIRTMHHLKRLDGLSDETPLRRLVSPDAEPRPTLPPIQEFRLSEADAETAALCGYFTTLTELRLEYCTVDPGEVLLSHLPHLKQFAFIVGGVQFVPAQVLLDGIARYAPQLSHLQFEDREMTEDQLSKFLPKMPHLTSLWLTYCRVITRLDFLKSAPQLKELGLCNVGIVSRDELVHARHIAKIELMSVFDPDDDDEIIYNSPIDENRENGPEQVSSATNEVPAPPLVGIELNPGPGPFQPQLSTDVFRLITSFMNYHPDWYRTYQPLVSCARTCRSWLAAVESMKPHHHELRVDLLPPNRLSHDLLMALLSSRLRHHVNTIKYERAAPDIIFKLLNEINLKERMPHVMSLDLEFDLTTKEARQFSLPPHLPPSLHRLSIVFIQPPDPSIEKWFSPVTEVSIESELEADLVASQMQIERIMSHIAASAEVDCTQLYELRCYPHKRTMSAGIQISGVDERNELPPEALRSWLKFTTIRHLTVNEPALSCIDIIRTMSQIERIDGLEKDYHLERFVNGNMSVIDTPLITRLKSITSTHATTYGLALLSQLTSLTDLTLENCSEDPGESLLAHLPLLTRFSCRSFGLGVSTAAAILTSIARFAPQLIYLQLEGLSLQHNEMSELLTKMTRLESLVLKDYKTTSLSFLQHTPSSLTSLECHDMSLSSPSELNFTHHIAQVKMIRCHQSFSFNQPISFTFGAVPPSSPLVDIELNPGPQQSSSSTSSLHHQLYDDVLHSIFAHVTFYFDFVSLALTCKRWFEAACTMRFHHSTAFADINNFEAPPPKSRLSLLSKGDHHDFRFTSSRLRHCVSGLDMLQLTTTNVLPLRLNAITKSIPGLTELNLSLSLEPSDSFTFEISLPPSLVSLSLTFLLDSFDCDIEDDENFGAPDDENKDAYQRISECMTVFAAAVSLLSQFRHLSVCVNAMNTPAAALFPWRHVQSLVYLTLNSLSMQCVDIVRTMNHLQRIDGINQEEQLTRLVSTRLVEEDEETQLLLPNIRALYILCPIDYWMRLYARFTHVTALVLNGCVDRPGKLLLTHMSQLRQLEIIASDKITMDQLLPDLISYSPQLHRLWVNKRPRFGYDKAISNQILIHLLQGMKELQVLRLTSCFAITTLTPLLNAKPLTLKELEIDNLPITKEDQLVINQQLMKIRAPLYVTMKYSPTVVPPPVPLVGIELNPGPGLSSTSAATQNLDSSFSSICNVSGELEVASSIQPKSIPHPLYKDALHSIFFVLALEDIVAAALTCKPESSQDPFSILVVASSSSPIIPGLLSFHLFYPSLNMIRLVAHFTRLTHLNFIGYQHEEDSGLVFLTKLPYLTKLELEVDTSKTSITPATIMASIAQSTPQLHHLQLDHKKIKEEDIIAFLPRMVVLESFSLLRCRVISLACFISTPPSLTQLDLAHLPLASADELKYTRHIRFVNLVNCDRQWKKLTNIVVDDDSPTPRLVGIELNPGPTTLAHSLYADALHSIFIFLDLNSDYSLIHAASTCRQWMSACESMKPLSSIDCDDDASDSFGSSSNEFRFHRQLVHGQVASLLTSQLRHHVDSLIYARSGGRCSMTELLLDLSQLQSRMPHLRRLSIVLPLDLDLERIDPTTSIDDLTSLHLPSQLRSLDISFMFLREFEWSGADAHGQLNLDMAAYSKAFAKMITNTTSLTTPSASATAGSSLRHLTLSAQRSSNSFLIQLPVGVFQSWCDRRLLLPSLRSLDIQLPTLECVDLMRTMTQLKECQLDLPRLIRFVLGPNSVIRQLEDGSEDVTVTGQPLDASQLPPISKYTISYPTMKEFVLLSYFQHLTSLELSCLTSDPGPHLLARLKNLSRLSIISPTVVSVDFLTSIISHASQLQHCQFMMMTFTAEGLVDFVQKMNRLESLTLKASYQYTADDAEPIDAHFIQRLMVLLIQRPHSMPLRIRVFNNQDRILTDEMIIPPAPRLVGIELNPGPLAQSLYHDASLTPFLDARPPPLTQLHIVNLSISKEEQLYVQLQMTKIRPPVTVIFAPPLLPPPKRLVGIELNPGPQLLYNDVLHSIYSFIDIRNAKHQDFISPALTCKRWLKAASAIKFQSPPSRRHDDDDDDDTCEYEILRQRLPRPMYTESFTALCSSRLRHIVFALRVPTFEFETFEKLGLLQQHMPHLQHLHLSIELSDDMQYQRVDIKQAASTYCGLSSSLESLTLAIIAQQSYSEALTTEGHDEETDPPERRAMLERMSSILQLLAHGARSSCPRLTRLELVYEEFRKDMKELQHLPACILEPWATNTSVEHLIAPRPSIQCVDIMCKMHQLKRLDGVVQEKTLDRLIYDPDTSNGKKRRSDLLRLRTYFLPQYCTAFDLATLSYFYGLTSLNIRDCDYDPGEWVLSCMPELKKFTCYEGYLSLIDIGVLLDGIAKYTPKLEYLRLSHPRMTAEQLETFLPRMQHLTTLVLQRCSKITRLSFLAVALPSLTSIDLSYLPVKNVDELAHTRRFAQVKLKLSVCGAPIKNLA